MIHVTIIIDINVKELVKQNIKIAYSDYITTMENNILTNKNNFVCNKRSLINNYITMEYNGVKLDSVVVLSEAFHEYLSSVYEQYILNLV